MTGPSDGGPPRQAGVAPDASVARVPQDSGPEPAVSIILPVYNTDAYIAEAVASVRAQSFGDFEAIVVDDGSTDGSAAAAETAIAGDARFRLIRGENRGLSGARNRGLDVARGRLIAFLDSDDAYDPAFLATMIEALEASGAAWAACAVTLVFPKREVPHAAIHGRTHPAAREPHTQMPLADWREIVSHWPSAWNKIYRRALVEGMRFAEGLNFEDHPWFHEAADRADSLAYVPQPLYRHRRAREGQITGTDSDRVFDQFAILARSAAILRASSKPGSDEGLARIATRVIHERSGPLIDPARRARFTREASAVLAREGLAWSPGWDRSIARSFAHVMEGRVPVTVVIATDGAGPGLGRTVQSLAAQNLRDAEILIVQTTPGAAGRQTLLDAASALPNASVLAAGAVDATAWPVAAARNRGLAAARGLYIMFLDAGDALAPGALWLWVEAMLREGADLGLSRFRQEGNAQAPHSGCHDGRMPFGDMPPELPQPTDRQPDWLALTEGAAKALPQERALAIHAHPSAKIFRTEYLRAEGLTFPPEPLASWDLTLRAALGAPCVLAFGNAPVTLSTRPGDRRLWRTPVPPARLHTALMRLAPALDPLFGRAGWYPRLLARALWEKANFADFQDDSARAAFWAEAGPLARTEAPDPPPESFDPYVGARIRALFTASAGHDTRGT